MGVQLQPELAARQELLSVIRLMVCVERDGMTYVNWTKTAAIE